MLPNTCATKILWNPIVIKYCKRNLRKVLRLKQDSKQGHKRKVSSEPFEVPLVSRTLHLILNNWHRCNPDVVLEEQTISPLIRIFPAFVKNKNDDINKISYPPALGIRHGFNFQGLAYDSPTLIYLATCTQGKSPVG